MVMEDIGVDALASKGEAVTVTTAASRAAIRWIAILRR